MLTERRAPPSEVFRAIICQVLGPMVLPCSGLTGFLELPRVAGADAGSLVEMLQHLLAVGETVILLTLPFHAY